MSLQRVGQARKWQRWSLALAILPLAGWMLFEAQRTFRAEWATLAAREQIVRWLTAESTPQDVPSWGRALASLQQGLALTPHDPALHERMGDLYSVAGRSHWDKPTLRNQHFQHAATWYESALELRPGSAAAWAALATARQAIGDSPARVQEPWNRALRLGPFEGHVQPVLLQVVLVDWDHASPAMQAWAKGLFDRSDPATRAQINVLARYYGLAFAPDEASAAPAKP